MKQSRHNSRMFDPIAEEEGHYIPLVGSRSFVGDIEEAEIDRAVNVDHGCHSGTRSVGLAWPAFPDLW
ncbi:hypothetical protein [Mesorhizobium temperatum]|uniref:hypothetical protein n=1 Tax=Mesorhizobium temperatum TaxID=241416 RepID=UPI001FD9C3D3|nr:hypothetical protein [Mesorhizobium temperatum]